MPRLIPMPIFFCISAGVVGVDDDAEAHAKAERTSRLRMSKRGNAESYGKVPEGGAPWSRAG